MEKEPINHVTLSGPRTECSVLPFLLHCSHKKKKMKFAHKSYLKPLLHAAKYPTTAVSGVFIADKTTGQVVDAVPLFHFWNSLTPMLEVAMSQVLEKQPGLSYDDYDPTTSRLFPGVCRHLCSGSSSMNIARTKELI